MSRLIDADALIDKYGDWYTEEGTEEGYIGTIKGIVDSMPTIDPERKTGKWIPINGAHQWKCSNCGEYIGGGTDCTPSINKFCWNCGAKMEVSP